MNWMLWAAIVLSIYGLACFCKGAKCPTPMCGLRWITASWVAWIVSTTLFAVGIVSAVMQ